METYMGTIFSKDYIWRKVLRFNDAEKEEMLDQLKQESQSGSEDGGFDMDNSDGFVRNPEDKDEPEDDPFGDEPEDQPEPEGGESPEDGEETPPEPEDEIDSEFIKRKTKKGVRK